MKILVQIINRLGKKSIFDFMNIVLNQQWVAEDIAGNVGITRRSREGRADVCRWIYKDIACKEQLWGSNICGEKFQSVGKTIYIKSKNASFPPYINNFNLDFQNFDFFYNVILILLTTTKKRKTLNFLDGNFFLEKSISQVFGRKKLHKKDLEIYIFKLKKVISIKRSVLLYCVSNRHFLCQILLCTNAVLQNWHLNWDNFLK